MRRALLARRFPVWLSVIAAFFAGALAGFVTGLLHTAFGIPSILAGILTQLMLYSVNLTFLAASHWLPLIREQTISGSYEQ
jgi:putative ABC transport system permease protein